MNLALKLSGWVPILVAVVYDLATPDDQNATAVLLAIGGLLVMILAELRELNRSTPTHKGEEG